MAAPRIVSIDLTHLVQAALHGETPLDSEEGSLDVEE